MQARCFSNKVSAARGTHTRDLPAARGAALQNGAFQFPALRPLDVAVCRATVVRLARSDLAHQVKEHLGNKTLNQPPHINPLPPYFPQPQKQNDTVATD